MFCIFWMLRRGIDVVECITINFTLTEHQIYAKHWKSDDIMLSMSLWFGEK